jgi:hypothetical protein
MRRRLLAAGALVLLYLLLREAAWRGDFMAALNGLGHGRPLGFVAGVGYLAARLSLLLLGPPLLAGAGLLFAWRRLTKS